MGRGGGEGWDRPGMKSWTSRLPWQPSREGAGEGGTRPKHNVIPMFYT